jgi:hypothetical protein
LVFSSGGQRVAIVFATELEGDEESLGIIDDSLIIVDAARPISDAAYQHLVWRELRATNCCPRPL